jgi:hypothetical protein
MTTHEESQRVWREFQRLYQMRPQWNVRANDDILLEYARGMGGTEMFTAENCILWFDSTHNQLAVLQELPQDAMEKFMQENPGFSCEANRLAILRHLRGHQINAKTIAEAVHELGSSLAFDAVVQQEHHAGVEQRELEAERTALIEEIILAGGTRSGTAAQDGIRKRLQDDDIETLRTSVKQLRDEKRFRGMSAYELKQHIIAQQQEQSAPVASGLPAEFTAAAIKALEPQKIKRLAQRFGWDAVNARLQQ